jgi:salicylate hydroxylase
LIPALSSVEFNIIDEHSYRCSVPKSAIRNNPKLDWLLQNDNETAWMGPGKYVLAWPLPTDKPYDVVCSIACASDIPAGKWGIVADPEEVSEEFSNFCPEVRELLDKMDRSIKWTLAELPPLSTCRSENGRVVLMGDAWHA